MERGGELYARRIPGFPRILFGRERGNLRSDKMADVLPAENVERKTTSQIPRSDFEVCCKCSLFIFDQIFGLKIDDRYV